MARRRRAGRSLRARSKREIRLALRANRRVLILLATGGVGIFVLAIGGVSALQAWISPEPWWRSSFQRGELLGATVIGLIWWGSVAFNAVTTGVDRLRRGALGEEYTASALRWLRVRGWRVLHDLEWPGEFNIDHVAIGPGGVLAIESKYTTGDWRIGANGLTGPIGHPLRDAQRGARRVAEVLGAAGVNVEVLACLVIWGPGAPDISGGRIVLQDVRVLEGRKARVWRAKLLQRQGTLDRATIRAAMNALLNAVSSVATPDGP